MVDLHKTREDLKEALNSETEPQITILINRAYTAIQMALQLKDFEASKGIDISELGIPDERGPGRRMSDLS